ncbi:WAP four-disulfide core domain protein 8-like [Crotalus adamanteus]|uniref:WAP four-disulfide core domain protein 8-like n=1 Tax=Crotalus adamanteus TaxID=8729 RepID=A0AAW1BSV5_CROAD
MPAARALSAAAPLPVGRNVKSRNNVSLDGEGSWRGAVRNREGRVPAEPGTKELRAVPIFLPAVKHHWSPEKPSSGDLPGYCPLLILPPRRGDVCFPNCTSDWDCNRMVNLPLKKCCSFAGRQICVHGVEEHLGVCPRRVELQTLLPCNNTCRDDLDCSLTEKCCFTGCGRGCLPSLRSEVCQLPLEQGSCKQQLQRYFYDPDKKKCVSYRVCKAGHRNFETKELCEKACGKISKGTEDQCCIEAPGAEALCPPTTPLFSSQSNSSSNNNNNNKNNAPKNESLHNIPAYKPDLGSRCLLRGCHGHCPSCIPV